MGGAHSHSHSHDHSHGAAGHSHAPADFGRAFAIGIVLNSAFVIVEATYGFLSGSMALVADAGHNLSDVLALMLAWGASVAAKKPASPRYTYGFKSSTILAALANAMLLAIAIGAILFETMHRILEPAPVEGMTMVVVTHELASIFAIGSNSVFLDVSIRTMTATGNPSTLLAETKDPTLYTFLTRGETLEK